MQSHPCVFHPLLQQLYRPLLPPVHIRCPSTFLSLWKLPLSCIYTAQLQPEAVVFIRRHKGGTHMNCGTWAIVTRGAHALARAITWNLSCWLYSLGRVSHSSIVDSLDSSIVGGSPLAATSFGGGIDGSYRDDTSDNVFHDSCVASGCRGVGGCGDGGCGWCRLRLEAPVGFHLC